MPKKKSRSHTGAFTIDAETYTALCDTMKELAFRGTTEESVVMRVANAGGIDDVVNHIKRLRLYAKKHRDGGDEVEETTEATPRKRKRSRSRSAQGGKDSASDQTNTA